MRTPVGVDIRLLTKADIPFVKDSWIKSMKYTYPHQYEMNFQERYNTIIDKLIENSLGLIAHLDTDPNEILSYIIYTTFRNNRIIHFTYTKVDARQEGIAGKLIAFCNQNNLPIVFTHSAKNENIMKHIVSKYIYDPSMLEIL